MNGTENDTDDTLCINGNCLKKLYDEISLQLIRIKLNCLDGIENYHITKNSHFASVSFSYTVAVADVTWFI